MTDAVDDRPEASAALAAQWASEDGPSYALPRCRARAPWALPLAVSLVAVVVLACVVAALLLTSSA